jgi:hypothetical protein
VALLVSLFAFVSLSCSNERCECPEPEPATSGRATVDAQVRTDQHGNLFSEAFSFPEGEVIRVPNESDIEPDILVGILMDTLGEPCGILLGQQDNAHAFSYIGGADTEDAGRSLFNHLTCVPDSAEFTAIAGVQPYDVLVVRARDGRLAKILVVDTFFFEQDEGSPGNTLERYYGEVTFDWVFQPDGDRCFE